MLTSVMIVVFALFALQVSLVMGFLLLDVAH